MVAQRVRALVGHHGPRQVAVLARTNDQLGAIDRALRAAGVPTELAAARTGARTPLQLVIDEVARLGSREQVADWAERVWVEGSADGLRRRVAEEVDRFLSSGMPGGIRAWVDARHPFDDLEGAELDADDPAVSGDDGAVTLSTFHAAKGREWQAVVVTGVEQGLVPHGSSTAPAQLLEESRLLYVALTRASDDLTVTAAGSRKGVDVAESPWLGALRAAVPPTERRIAPPRDLPRRIHPPDPLEGLRAWRAGVARAAGVADVAVCSDRTLRSLLTDPPGDVAGLARRLGVGTGAAERLAPQLFSLLAERASA